MGLRKCFACWRSFGICNCCLAGTKEDHQNDFPTICMQVSDSQLVMHLISDILWNIADASWYFLCRILMVERLIIMDEIRDVVWPSVCSFIIFYIYFGRGYLICHWTLLFNMLETKTQNSLFNDFSVKEELDRSYRRK